MDFCVVALFLLFQTFTELWTQNQGVSQTMISVYC